MHKRPKSREETPKEGMQPEGCEVQTMLHCKLCKPLAGLFCVCGRYVSREGEGFPYRSGAPAPVQAVADRGRGNAERKSHVADSNR